MVVTPVSRNLLVQLQVGQTSAGKPKLHNRVYPHVDVSASDTAIDAVLTALAPLFTDPIYAMGRVDTVQLQNASPLPQPTGGATTGGATTGGGGQTTAGAGSSGASTATGGASSVSSGTGASGTGTTTAATGASTPTTGGAAGGSAAGATTGTGGSATGTPV